MDLQDTLEEIRAEIAPYIGGGAVADYIRAWHRSTRISSGWPSL